MGLCLIYCVAGALPSEDFKARYALLCISVSTTFASVPPLLSWLAGNLRNTGALTLAIPLDISIAQIGEIIGKHFRLVSRFGV